MPFNTQTSKKAKWNAFYASMVNPIATIDINMVDSEAAESETAAPDPAGLVAVAAVGTAPMFEFAQSITSSVSCLSFQLTLDGTYRN